ncbi:MAG: CIA30 family protein [Thiohalocapsa sp.]
MSKTHTWLGVLWFVLVRQCCRGQKARSAECLEYNAAAGMTAPARLRQTDAAFGLIFVLSTLMTSNFAQGGQRDLLIDDFSAGTDRSRLGTTWRLATDRVMGGVSDAAMSLRQAGGRRARCMRGDVSLENNGGFVQINVDLARDGYLDASSFDGVRLLVRGNSETYNLHLKTAATSMPWQSYRAEFVADERWREVRLPFAGFEPHRLDSALDLTRLKRLGVVAIGRVMHADLCLAEIGLFGPPD